MKVVQTLKPIRQSFVGELEDGQPDQDLIQNKFNDMLKMIEAVKSSTADLTKLSLD